MNMGTSMAGSHLSQIRMNHQVAEDLIKATANGMSDLRLMARLDRDENFMLRATRMGQELLVVTTIAQAIAVDDEGVFDELIAESVFSSQDDDLRTLGRAMVAKIAALARLEDDAISDEILTARFGKVLAAV